MKEINLTKGFKVLVDDDDYEYLQFYKWRAHVIYYKGNRNKFKVYAQTRRNYQSISLHRLITKCPKGLLVDHIDGNTLNNQKSNLRICTYSQNLQNQVSCVKRYKGTDYKPKDKRFNATIRVNKKNISLGYYKAEETAAYAYNVAALYYFKEFANLNKLDLTLVDFEDYNRYMVKKEAKLIASYSTHNFFYHSQY